MEAMGATQAIMVPVQCLERIHIRITTISHTIITIICITMAVYMAMAIIDMVEIGIMAADTTIEDTMADIMAVAADIMAADMGTEEEQHTEEDMREVLIEAGDTIAGAEEDMAERVVGDMPEAEAIEAVDIEAAATAEVVEATEAVELAAVVAEEAVEVVAAAGVVNTLLQGVSRFLLRSPAMQSA